MTASHYPTENENKVNVFFRWGCRNKHSFDFLKRTISTVLVCSLAPNSIAQYMFLLLILFRLFIRRKFFLSVSPRFFFIWLWLRVTHNSAKFVYSRKFKFGVWYVATALDIYLFVSLFIYKYCRLIRRKKQQKKCSRLERRTRTLSNPKSKKNPIFFLDSFRARINRFSKFKSIGHRKREPDFFLSFSKCWFLCFLEKTRRENKNNIERRKFHFFNFSCW